MKLPSHIHLDNLNIPYEARSFSPETEKGAANVAHALGFSERQAMKTLIFQVDTGERVLVMLGGDQNAVSGNLKKAIGSRNIQMAAPEVVKKQQDILSDPSPPLAGSPLISDPSLRRVYSTNPSSARAEGNGAKRS
ncbi:MAG: hypothetical protein IPN58_04865 [Anaerolineales bacterium]|nr:hypothetical protein [Anaerolineales bacterium]